jgi:hypothetical protein
MKITHKIKLLTLLFLFQLSGVKAQYSKLEWVSTTENSQWEKQDGKISKHVLINRM